jgi:hypothetical protein
MESAVPSLNKAQSGRWFHPRNLVGGLAPLPSPLVGEGGSHERSECETGEGSVSADRDPSSGALRAPPSPTRGEGKEGQRNREDYFLPSSTGTTFSGDA